MSEVKRYTAWAAEVALPRGTMVVLAADYDALAAENERLTRIAVLWQEKVEELERELLPHRIAEGRAMASGALAGQQQSCASCGDFGSDCDVCGHRSGQPQHDEPKLPEGWTNLRIEYESGYPEDVAFGPQRMMDRLKKWLDAYFAMKIEQSVAEAEQPVIYPEDGPDERATLAPAAVVMPERMTGFSVEDDMWNSALEEVARLNRNTVPLELLERIADMLANPTHYNPSACDASADELRAILAGDKS